MRSTRASASLSLSCALLVPATAAGVALLASGCSSQKSCALVSCESTATVRMTANVAPADLPNATITACRKEATGATPSCSSGKIVSVPATPGDRIQFTLSGPLDVRGFVRTPEGGKGFGIEIVQNLEGVAVADGDTYEIKVDLNGTSVGAISEPAKYDVVRPNGADCPPVCRTTVIDKS